MDKKSSSVENIFKLDGKVPLGKAIPFGLQHVLAMFVSNLAPISIIALVFIGILVLLNVFFYQDYYMMTRRSAYIMPCRANCTIISASLVPSISIPSFLIFYKMHILLFHSTAHLMPCIDAFFCDRQSSLPYSFLSSSRPCSMFPLSISLTFSTFSCIFRLFSLMSLHQ